MYCPNCQYQLQKLEVTTTSGGRFEVDHCGRCGGTWFDPYEINRIPYHEVARLAGLTVLPKNPILHPLDCLCPRCHKTLKKFHAESLPKGISMYRCIKCHGIWASQNALEEFKKEQQEVIGTYQESTKIFPALSLVFMPAVFMILLLFSTLLTLNKLSTARDDRTEAKTLTNSIALSNISNSSLLLYFPTVNPLRASIIYRDSNFNYRTQIISNNPAKQHQLILSGLKPDTFYYYYLRLEDSEGNSYNTPEAIFKTLP